jgi:hypothetical protein
MPRHHCRFVPVRVRRRLRLVRMLTPLCLCNSNGHRSYKQGYDDGLQHSFFVTLQRCELRPLSPSSDARKGLNRAQSEHESRSLTYSLPATSVEVEVRSYSVGVLNNALNVVKTDLTIFHNLANTIELQGDL